MLTRPSPDPYAANFAVDKLSATAFPYFAVENASISSDIHYLQSPDPYIFESSASGFARFSSFSLHVLAALSPLFGNSGIGAFIVFMMNLSKLSKS